MAHNKDIDLEKAKPVTFATCAILIHQLYFEVLFDCTGAITLLVKYVDSDSARGYRHFSSNPWSSKSLP